MRYSGVDKHLVDKDIVTEEGDGLGEDRIVMVQGQCEDSLIEDGVSQDIDQEDFSLGNVRDARPTQMYSFLPASWTGDTHEETDFLPIGDREEKDM